MSKEKFYFKNYRSDNLANKENNDRYPVLDLVLRLEYYRMNPMKNKLIGLGTLTSAMFKIWNGISDWIDEAQINSVISHLSTVMQKDNIFNYVSNEECVNHMYNLAFEYIRKKTNLEIEDVISHKININDAIRDNIIIRDSLNSDSRVTSFNKAIFPINVYSWKILNETVFVKKIDKSTFIHKGTAIPKEIREYFNIENIKPGEKKKIELLYNNKAYEAYFEREAQSLHRTRLFWYADFKEVLESEFPVWNKVITNGNYVKEKAPSIRFKLLDEASNIYKIDFIRLDEIEQDIESEEDQYYEPKAEGAVKKAYITRYERNPQNKTKALEIHGYKCKACNFDFEKQYGDRGKEYIEVHHINPLFETDGEKEIDPEHDLVPVCSNCHKMIHRRKDNILSIEELKEIIQYRFEDRDYRK